MNKLGEVLIFAAGAAIGSLITWKIVKTKYERIAEEEIESVKNVFSRKEKENMKKPSAKIADKPSLQEMADQLKKLKYVAEENESKIHVIDADDFGNGEYDYDLISLDYYSDDVLADEFGTEIMNPKDVIGTEALALFGDPDVNTVYVRNDKLKSEYEIVFYDEKFSDISQLSPPEDEEEEEEEEDEE